MERVHKIEHIPSVIRSFSAAAAAPPSPPPPRFFFSAHSDIPNRSARARARGFQERSRTIRASTLWHAIYFITYNITPRAIYFIIYIYIYIRNIIFTNVLFQFRRDIPRM